MNIVVCCKAVPGLVTEVKVGADAKSLEYQGQLLAINECDEYALEEALALKRAHGGNVTVVTMGNIKALEILYFALAKGADRAVRVDCETSDARVASTVLAAALKKLDFDLVLTGTQARDTLGGQVGIAAAALLGLPFAYAVVEIQMASASAVKARKELGGGRYAEVELSLPALLCVQTGIQPLAFVPPARRMRARQQSVASFTPADLGLDPAALAPKGYRLVDVHPPQRSHRVEFLDGTPQEIAAALISKIREAL
ncbi:MAG TPA: electron transfer flavoprotein subunit beta/FixA family protein [Candidatus Acidoferrales bacterium]|nr:electron transfer flavoprotein subunit beta/FixA family protein [Candidatus Acidoferrales bacterium]